MQHRAAAFVSGGGEGERLARLAASFARHVSHRCHGAHASLACAAGSGELLTLQAGQAFVHDCVAVLVRGSLVARGGATEGGGTTTSKEAAGGLGGSGGSGQAVVRGVPRVAGLGGRAVEGRAPFTAPALLAWSAAAFPDLGHVQQGGGGTASANVLVAGPEGAQIIVA
jgi:hypothetical protein